MTSLSFLPFIEQHARLIDIATALPDAALVVERFSGREAVSETFRFTIDCLSTHAYFPLDALISEEITVRLQLADGTRRVWHGHVTQAVQLGGDGGLARYRLIVEPWLALLDHRRNCCLLQDVDALGAVGAVFAAYLQADWRADVTQPLRTHSRLTQYHETDLAFVRRILAAEGLSFRFEHDQAATAGDATAHARHRLVIFDRNAARPVCAQPEIRFHRADAPERSDTIQVLQDARTVQSNKVSLSGWDYKQLSAPAADVTSANGQFDLPVMEVYEGAAAYPFTSVDTAHQHADRQLAAFEARTRRVDGQGRVRSLADGVSFRLLQHDRHIDDEGQFSVLSVEHHAANNLGAGMARLLGTTDVENGTYRNRFSAQPASAPIVPLPLPKPVAQPQNARVVGHAGAPLSTERDHRIKVQFHWQRGEAPNPGGLVLGAPSGGSEHSERGGPPERRAAPSTGAAPSGGSERSERGGPPERRAAPSTGAAPSGGSELSERGGHTNAPGDERSGTWVRVAEWLAGANWGSHFLPRIGTDVLVDFIDGDIDRPVIVSQLFTGEDLPPFSAGVEATANHPGVISGWMSHNHGTGFNQWLVDDAPGQLRTRLATSATDAQLGLGHLIHHAPLSATRGPWRGSGFELRTDGWLAVRAGEGLLLSASSRSNAISTQMDVSEALAQLRAAERTAQTLSDAAGRQGAQALAGNDTQTRFIGSIDPAREGKYTADVSGQPTRKAQPGSRSLGDPVERFADPVILAEAPDDIGLSSPASTVVFAGDHLHATVQQDWHLAAAHTLATTVGHAASWFSHTGGIKCIAAAGPHSLQAHTDALDILADKAITLTSSNDEIRILAKDRIVLTAGQSSVTLSGGDITFACPGKFSVKGGGNAFLGPGKAPASFEGLPIGTVQEIPHWIEIERKYSDGDAVQGAAVKVTFGDGTIRTANLDSKGFARIEGTPAGIAEIEIGEDIRSWAPDNLAEPKLNPAYGKRLTKEQAARLYDLFVRETSR